MSSDDLCSLSLAEAARRIAARELSPVELTRAALDRISALDPRLNAFITVTAEGAMEQARQAEATLAAGEPTGPLLGIPIGLKDLFDTKDVRTTAGSKLLARRVPSDDAAVVARLRSAGAVFVGKLNMHEFAYGITNDNPHYGAAHNPWVLTRITGGSSGGSGTAVAAGLCVAALGSDTGGSIRIPACFCGIVGLKPTFGRVSRYGVIPLSSSLDHVGPMTRTVEDAALMLQVLAGHDPRDPGSVPVPVPDYTAGLTGGVRGLRIGVMAGDREEWTDPEVAQAVAAAVETLGALGARLQRVDLTFLPYARMLNGAILSAEAAAYHETSMQTSPDDYSPDVRERLARGQQLLATAFIHALEAREGVREQLRVTMHDCDVLALPMEPLTAPPIGADEVTVGGHTAEVRATVTRYTGLFNLTGFPAVSVPCGFTAEGLPIGFQLVGKPFDEATLLRAAYAYEQATEWGRRRPAL